MRCGSRPEGPDQHVRPRPGTVRIRKSGTASNYGSGMENRTRILYQTGTRLYFVFLTHKKLVNAGPSPVLRSGPSRTDSHSSHCYHARRKWWHKIDQEDDYRYRGPIKVSKTFEKLKHKLLAFSGSHLRIRHRWRIHRFGSGPKSRSGSRNRWHQSGTEPWLVAGSEPWLRYHRWGPGSQHIMLDPDLFGCLTTVTKREKVANWGQIRKR
jgi:hypothetical protein